MSATAAVIHRSLLAPQMSAIVVQSGVSDSPYESPEREETPRPARRHLHGGPETIPARAVHMTWLVA